MTRTDPLRRARRWVAFALAVAVVVSGIVLLLNRNAGGRPAAGPEDVTTTSGGATTRLPMSTGATQGGAQAPADPAAYEIARLRALDPPPTGGSDATAATPRRIVGEPTQQPDLYAAEFVRRLLTQDYRTDRAALLRWVQAESAQTREPLVIGLIPPELRDRYAVFSVTDIADESEAGAATAPIPSADEWQALGLQHGYTTVTIQRVEEPLAWTNAVASGRITDPGITGRDVTASVVRHTTVDGKPRQARFSVAISVNLEGPQTRASWGFVAAINYTSIQVS